MNAPIRMQTLAGPATVMRRRAWVKVMHASGDLGSLEYELSADALAADASLVFFSPALRRRSRRAFASCDLSIEGRRRELDLELLISNVHPMS